MLGSQHHTKGPAGVNAQWLMFDPYNNKILHRQVCVKFRDFLRTSKISILFSKSTSQVYEEFYTDLGLHQQCQILQKIVKFKDFSRPLSEFPVFFKADLILSGKPCIFKYFSRML